MSNLQVVTPKLASEYIEKGSSHDPELLGQLMRPIRRNWVNALADRMKRDLFAPTSVIAIGHYNGCVFILNGNHTLRAIVESKTSQRLPIQHYNIESIDQLRKYYATFDRGLSRSSSDSYRAYGVALEYGLNSSELNRLVSSVKFIAGGFATSPHSKFIDDSSILNEVSYWVEPFKFIRNIAAGSVLGKEYVINRRAVLSVALVTALGKPEQAYDFWSRTCSGTHIADNEPPFKLFVYLQRTTVIGGGDVSKANADTSPRMSRKVVHLWNKYYKGEKVDQIRGGFNEKDVMIQGCKHVKLPQFFVQTQ